MLPIAIGGLGLTLSILKILLIIVLISAIVLIIVKAGNYLLDTLQRKSIKQALEEERVTRESVEVVKESSQNFANFSEVFTFEFLLPPGSKYAVGEVIFIYDYYDYTSREVYLTIMVGTEKKQLILPYRGAIAEEFPIGVVIGTEANTYTINGVVYMKKGIKSISIPTENGIIRTQYEYPILEFDVTVEVSQR